MTPADRDAALMVLTSLSDQDKAQVAAMTDPAEAAQLVRAYALAGAKVDRSTIGQVEAYLSSLSLADWEALAKAVLPPLVAIL